MLVMEVRTLLRFFDEPDSDGHGALYGVSAWHWVRSRLPF